MKKIIVLIVFIALVFITSTLEANPPKINSWHTTCRNLNCVSQSGSLEIYYSGYPNNTSKVNRLTGVKLPFSVNEIDQVSESVQLSINREINRSKKISNKSGIGTPPLPGASLGAENNREKSVGNKKIRTLSLGSSASRKINVDQTLLLVEWVVDRLAERYRLDREKRNEISFYINIVDYMMLMYQKGHIKELINTYAISKTSLEKFPLFSEPTADTRIAILAKWLRLFSKDTSLNPNYQKYSFDAFELSAFGSIPGDGYSKRYLRFIEKAYSTGMYFFNNPDLTAHDLQKEGHMLEAAAYARAVESNSLGIDRNTSIGFGIYFAFSELYIKREPLKSNILTKYPEYVDGKSAEKYLAVHHRKPFMKKRIVDRPKKKIPKSYSKLTKRELNKRLLEKIKGIKTDKEANYIARDFYDQIKALKDKEKRKES